MLTSLNKHYSLRCVTRLNSVVCRRKFSNSIVEMLVVCATTVHRVGLQTAPNELCPKVPLMAWNTCAFTIQAIGRPTPAVFMCLLQWFYAILNVFTLVCSSSQKTFCGKMTSRSLGPYKTDRLDIKYEWMSVRNEWTRSVLLSDVRKFPVLVVVACWTESNCEVFSSSEAHEFPGRHSEAFCWTISGWVCS